MSKLIVSLLLLSTSDGSTLFALQNASENLLPTSVCQAVKDHWDELRPNSFESTYYQHKRLMKLEIHCDAIH